MLKHTKTSTMYRYEEKFISHFKRASFLTSTPDIGLPCTTTVVSAVLFSFVTELEATQVRTVLYGGVTGVKNMEEFVDRSVLW